LTQAARETSLIHIAAKRNAAPVNILASLILTLCLAWPGLAFAGERVTFDNVRVYPAHGRYVIDLDARVRMRRRPTQALEKGVSLYFNLDVDVFRQRTFWPDSVERSIRKRYRLFYFELTQHYRITEIRSGKSVSFKTLDEASQHLSHIRGLPLLDVARVRDPGRYRVRVKMGLDYSELPTPLQLQAYTTRRWRLRSEETVWPLD